MNHRKLSDTSMLATGKCMYRPILFVFVLSISILINTPAKAEVKTLSRANCIGYINKSITYDRPGFRSFFGTAVGMHKPWGEVSFHEVSDASNYGEQLQWRYYAGDIGDSASIKVTGSHAWVVLDDMTNELLDSGFAVTTATDCNLTEW